MRFLRQALSRNLGIYLRFMMVVTGIGLAWVGRDESIGWTIYYVSMYLLVAQIIMSSAWSRGNRAAHRERDEEEALRLNAQMVAMSDLAEIAERYNIPAWEFEKVVERGFRR